MRTKTNNYVLMSAEQCRTSFAEQRIIIIPSAGMLLVHKCKRPQYPVYIQRLLYRVNRLRLKVTIQSNVTQRANKQQHTHNANKQEPNHKPKQMIQPEFEKKKGFKCSMNRSNTCRHNCIGVCTLFFFLLHPSQRCLFFHQCFWLLVIFEGKRLQQHPFAHHFAQSH